MGYKLCAKVSSDYYLVIIKTDFVLTTLEICFNNL